MRVRPNVWTVALMAGLAGCGSPPATEVNEKSEAPPPATARQGTIGFSALTLKNPFFKIIADSLTEEARRNGFEVVVSDAERDVQEQTKHVENYLAQRVTAIVLNPTDRIAIGPAIRKANEAGVPVFTCDLECELPDVEVAGHVGTDNYGGGKLAGQAMIEVLGDAGGEVLIVHFKQANSCVERVRGFREVIEQHNQGRAGGKIEIVAELEGGGLQDQGFRATADALQAHPNLNAIFAINDPSALGAWKALQQVGKTEHVKIIGFDGQLDGKQAIKEGKIYADPIQFPEKMGVLTMNKILAFLDGEPFEQKTYIPTELYRQADAERDPALQQGERK
jgi:ribose transport system substrate-binding protein